MRARYRTGSAVNEPRGSVHGRERCCGRRIIADCSLGVIFFNNVGYSRHACHGTIGLVRVARARRPPGPGPDAGIDRRSAPVDAEAALPTAAVRRRRRALRYRRAQGVGGQTSPASGRWRGDVAWGGNCVLLADAGDPAASGSLTC
mgnify:CR=1 FL=1